MKKIRIVHMSLSSYVDTYLEIINKDNEHAFNFQTGKVSKISDLSKRYLYEGIDKVQVFTKDWDDTLIWLKYVLLYQRKKMPKLRCAQQRRTFSYPKVQGWEQAPIFSRGKKDFKTASPFILGPVEFSDGDEEHQSANFENLWQGLKVWEKFKGERHLGKNGKPTKAWESWRDSMFENEKAIRRPNPGALPEGHWFGGKLLGVIEAREKIYVPLYKKNIKETAIFKKILNGMKKGTQWILIEPDGPPIGYWPDGMDVTYEELKKLVKVTRFDQFKQVVNSAPDRIPEEMGEDDEKPNKDQKGFLPEDKYMPYGHGYVFAIALLEEFIKSVKI